MGCALCGRRQVDPESGPSAWRRAVRGGEQVLVCPDCQVEGWDAAFDACASCGSHALSKRLGVVSCRGCRAEVPVSDSALASRTGDDDVRRAALAREVAEALDRTLGTRPGAD